MTFSAKQETAALALAAGKTAEEAAAECSCCKRTIQRWLAEVAGFRARVQEIRTELFGLAVGRLSDLSGKAATALGQLLESDTEGIRLQAARSILEHGPKLREATDLAGKMDDLERQMTKRVGELERRLQAQEARRGEDTATTGGEAGGVPGDAGAGRGQPGQPGGEDSPDAGGDPGGAPGDAFDQAAGRYAAAEGIPPHGH
jgi:hypothetical protein